MKNILIIFGLILAFIGGYFLSQKYNFKIETKIPTPILTVTIEPTSNQEPLVGGDSDEHGCKGSAGYSWCEKKQKCVREWEEPCIDEEAIKQALVIKHGWNSDDIIVTVSKSTGQYAKGSVIEKSSETGGGMFLAMKNDDQWEIIFDGNGVPDCNQLKITYLFPATILAGVCD